MMSSFSVSTIDASPGVELSQTKEQLVVSECRIRHLTGLLSEAERDLAKLTQQNQVLKDEIRRQQRSVEREQHAQNFEYLKNVVLKVSRIKNVKRILKKIIKILILFPLLDCFHFT
jgi:hypothetical protein